MRVRLECLECIVRQARTTAERCTPDAELRARIVKETMRRVSADALDRSPAEHSLAAYTVAAELSGVPDPFLADKDEQNAHALAMCEELRARIACAADPLHTAAKMSVAGNVVDLGVGLAFDVRREIEKVLSGELAVDHFARFAAELAAARTLLVLCDNCGEIVFDKLFIEAIRARAPGLHVTAVVKGAPIINDATLREAAAVGLGDAAEVVSTGCACIGAPPRDVDPHVVELLRSCDIVVSKGQGNFETVSDLPRATYFLLKAKCPCVADELGVRFGDVVFMRREGTGTW